VEQVFFKYLKKFAQLKRLSTGDRGFRPLIAGYEITDARKSDSMIELLENLYREHRQGLFTFALSVVGSADLAEDAIQNAFTNLLRQSHQQESNCESELTVGYLFRAVRNAAVDLLRSDKRKRVLGESLFEEFRLHDGLDEPSNHLLTKERNEILRRAVNELPVKDKEAVVLKLFAGLTFDQSGEVAETSPKTMATRYRRAIAKLENQLKGQL
jgi:RNA polymerase sigma-70 factor (ECF subfamily)